MVRVRFRADMKGETPESLAALEDPCVRLPIFRFRRHFFFVSLSLCLACWSLGRPCSGCPTLYLILCIRRSFFFTYFAVNVNTPVSRTKAGTQWPFCTSTLSLLLWKVLAVSPLGTDGLMKSAEPAQQFDLRAERRSPLSGPTWCSTAARHLRCAQH